MTINHTASVEAAERGRLVLAVEHALGFVPNALTALPAGWRTQPVALADRLRPLLSPHDVVVTGTYERRLLLVGNHHTGVWTAADLSGKPHSSRIWPAWSVKHFWFDDPDSWLSRLQLSDEARHRLTRPRVLLVALYHPEYFPLPRFPLAISDLARAARATLLGQVELMDMQLGVGLPDILARIAAWPAVPSCLLEPVWAEFHAAIGGDRPQFSPAHPLGCHRRRIPDRVVFEHLVDALVHGSGCERIATAGCSDRTIRRRLKQWAADGVAHAVHSVALRAYDLIIGLELADVSVDGCITKAPCGGEKAGPSPVDRRRVA